MSNEDRASLSVLVVDDNLANREVARHVLSLSGHAVIAVESGPAAVKARQVQAFDAILMDINMPGMDGLTATLWLRAMETPHDRAPIFALTAYYGARDQGHFERCGLDAVMTKPFNLQTFATLMKSYRVTQTLREDGFARMQASIGAARTEETYHIVLTHTRRLSVGASADAVLTLARVADELGMMAMAKAARACAYVREGDMPLALSWLHREADIAREVLDAHCHALPMEALSVRDAAIPFRERDARSA